MSTPTALEHRAPTTAPTTAPAEQPIRTAQQASAAQRSPEAQSRADRERRRAVELLRRRAAAEQARRENELAMQRAMLGTGRALLR